MPKGPSLNKNHYSAKRFTALTGLWSCRPQSMAPWFKKQWAWEGGKQLQAQIQFCSPKESGCSEAEAENSPSACSAARVLE